MGDPAPVGKVLAGRYRLDAPIDGGAGRVFAATHRLTHEQVAVKFVSGARLGDEQIKQRLVQQAQGVASLQHPNIVRLLDLDEDDELGLFVVLERLQGQSLEERLAHGGRLEPRAVCEILLPIVRAISDERVRELAQRELEPANIFLHREPDGRITPKLLAFGLTRTEGDAAAGVRSMAATVYRSLSGEAVVDAGSRPPLPELRPDLPRAAVFEAVIARALSVDPAQSTVSLPQLMADLAAAAEVDPTAVLADPGQQPAAASRPSGDRGTLGAAELAPLTQVLDPSHLPPPPNFQRIANGAAIVLFVIAVLLVGSAMRRSSTPPAQGGAGAASPVPAEDEPLPGLMPIGR